MLTVVTERDALFDAEWRMNSTAAEERELEFFNVLKINLIVFVD